MLGITVISQTSETLYCLIEPVRVLHIPVNLISQRKYANKKKRNKTGEHSDFAHESREF